MLQNKEILLQVNNLTKEFKNNNGQKISALNNVTFSLYKNETLGIVGESGSGKSTLARILTKIYNQTSGDILLNGNNCNSLKKEELKKYRRNMQMVFQNPLAVFSPRMSIREFVCEGLVNYGIKNKKDSIIEMKKYLEAVGIDVECLNRFPHELSGGQLQRIVIARAISVMPDIIIYDEATSALDVSVQEKILRLISDIQIKMNLTSIFISHDLATIKKISDRVIVMFKGEIVEVLESKNIEKNALHPYTEDLINSLLSINDTKYNKKIELYDDRSFENVEIGCPYKNRCKRKIEICEHQKPLLKKCNLGTGKVSCHLY